MISTIDYQKIYPTAERYKAAMLEQIADLINKNRISLGVPIESRIKSHSSIENKIHRKNRSIESFYDLDDFVGIRLILLFRNDVNKICQIISSNFEVLQIEDTGERLAENEFGYQSNHMVIKMPVAWLSVPSFSDFDGFKVEIQVRTVAQHIWAAASHQLQYKNELSVPAPLKRAIHRTSALLEIIDLELQRLLDQREEYIASEAINAPGNSNINVDVLERILDEILPRENKLKSGEDLSNLLQELVDFGFSSPDKIRALIAKHIVVVLEEDAQRAMEDHSDAEEIERGREGVFYTHAGLVRGCMQLELGKPYEDRMRRFYEGDIIEG